MVAGNPEETAILFAELELSGYWGSIFALDLLLKNRIRYFLSLTGTRYIADEMGIADQIVYIPIEEMNHYNVVPELRRQFEELILEPSKQQSQSQ